MVGTALCWRLRAILRTAIRQAVSRNARLSLSFPLPKPKYSLQEPEEHEGGA